MVATLIGVGSGLLSGFFGVGGGVVSTPAIRVLLDTAPLMALGTPLPVTLPSAVSGGLRYARLGLVEWPVALRAACAGVPASILGAWATVLISGHVMMLITALVIALVGLDFVSGARSRRLASETLGNPVPWGNTRDSPSLLRRPLLVGVMVGYFSGFLGVGGGVLAVPLFVGWLKMPVKRAFGTSLVLVASIALPGSLVHFALGHVDWALAGLLALGVIPGAWVGSGFATRLSDARLLRAFGVFLLCVAAVFGYDELQEFLTGNAS